jgi:hypothetical protein
MTPDRRYPERVPRRHTGTARGARAARQSRYSVRRPLQSTRAVTVKLTLLAVVATLAIGGLIAAQMAAGNDPSLGPKAATRAKKAVAKSSTGASSTGTSSGSSSSSADPYSQAYGDDYYGSSSGYSSGSSSSGSSGYSSGYSTQQSAPAPVTSSTS